jgi:hypothetical protein
MAYLIDRTMECPRPGCGKHARFEVKTVSGHSLGLFCWGCATTVAAEWVSTEYGKTA